MSNIGEMYQSADWKTEKHVPVIECPDKVKADELFEVRASIGKEVAHPNTTAHHIQWIHLYFKPDDSKFVYQVGSFTFSAHGASTEGADAGPVSTHHAVAAFLKVKKAGTLFAASLCNIHGLWENSRKIEIA